MSEGQPEGRITLAAFAASLFHGERADNTFKFLHGKSEDDVDRFLQELFRQVVEAVDTGRAHALGDFLQQEQARAYAIDPEHPPLWGPKRPLEPVPPAQLAGPLGETTVALFSSAAARLPDQPSFLPEGMDLAAATRSPMQVFERQPTLRTIPSDARTDELVFEHIAYDLNGVRHDPNVMFPLDRLRELAAEGAFRLAPKAYSFKGLCNLDRLVRTTATEWAARLVEDGIGAVLLTPG